MGYEQAGDFDEMFRDGPMDEAVHLTVHRVGDDLRERAERHSPVGHQVDGGRPPGTLKGSWETGQIRAGATTSVDAYSTDPIAPYVEWNTRPHDIPNAFGFGHDFGIGGRFDGKFHPGTTGQHMMGRALAEVAATWRQIGMDEMAAWARRQA